jgi:hypothetical protein
LASHRRGYSGNHAQLNARRASAIYLFVITLIGLGIGPTAVALVTDYVFADDNVTLFMLIGSGARNT